jgi:DNA-binding GntR family transcriptional regulator
VLATTVEEVFDLYEVRAALYGLAARFTCLRATDGAIKQMVAKIDQLLDEAGKGQSAEHIIATSEAIFSAMAEWASSDAQKMIAAVRRKTRFHYSYVALAINTNGPGPYDHWRDVRKALRARRQPCQRGGPPDPLFHAGRSGQDHAGARVQSQTVGQQPEMM